MLADHGRRFNRLPVRVQLFCNGIVNIDLVVHSLRSCMANVCFCDNITGQSFQLASRAFYTWLKILTAATHLRYSWRLFFAIFWEKLLCFVLKKRIWSNSVNLISVKSHLVEHDAVVTLLLLLLLPCCLIISPMEEC